MPRCSSSPPVSWPALRKGSHRYLPRRATSPTSCSTSACGAMPSGQRSGLPSRTPVTRAPWMRSQKLWRVTSTSGNSGIRELSRSPPVYRRPGHVARPTKIDHVTGVLHASPSPLPHAYAGHGRVGAAARHRRLRAAAGGAHPLEPGCAAVLPAADRRDRAARGAGGHRVRSGAGRRAQDPRRAAVPPCHRHRAAGARG